jgi:drug/metabolite transporter (DMT)-like permease
MIWGFAFVAQKQAMAGLGPLTFSAVRYVLGTVVMLPLVAWELRRRRRLTLSPRQWGMIAVLCLSFFLGVYLQQCGLTATSATNGGFLTSLYVFFVPLLALFAFRQRPHPLIWLGMPVALLGVFLLNGGALDRFGIGDALMIGCAVAWAVQVYLVGRVARATALPITISVLCFAVTALLSTIGSFAVEVPAAGPIVAAWPQILYAGVLSTSVAFTFQAIGQQYVPPSNAAIVLSAEGLFAALGGAVILGERLPAIGYVGAALIFLAIVMVEAGPSLMARPVEEPSPS